MPLLGPGDGDYLSEPRDWLNRGMPLSRDTGPIEDMRWFQGLKRLHRAACKEDLSVSPGNRWVNDFPCLSVYPTFFLLILSQ